MTKEEEIKKLSEEYRILKKDKEKLEELRILKGKVWALKHNGFMRLGNNLLRIGKGIASVTKKGAKKVGEMGKNYEDSFSNDKRNNYKIKNINDVAGAID